jgi:hypothetical protein
LVNRSAIAKVAAISVMAVLIAAGAIGIYFYTAPVTNTFTSTASTTTTGTVTTTSVSVVGGSQGADGQPLGAWAAYLGYIPSGYVVAPHYPNAATYPCPSGMSPDQCKQFQTSCGNGACDPNESCATCPIDCSVAGQLTCDPYTGRAGSPISICQMPGRV